MACARRRRRRARTRRSALTFTARPRSGLSPTQRPPLRPQIRPTCRLRRDRGGRSPTRNRELASLRLRLVPWGWRPPTTLRATAPLLRRLLRIRTSSPTSEQPRRPWRPSSSFVPSASPSCLRTSTASPPSARMPPAPPGPLQAFGCDRFPGVDGRRRPFGPRRPSFAVCSASGPARLPPNSLRLRLVPGG